MKGFRIPEENVGFQMAPMIDIVFLLIIFFMVAANLKQNLRVDVDLPVAEKSQVPDEPGNRGTISIRPDGSVYVGALPCPPDLVGQQVLGLATDSPGFRVFIRADRATPHRHVANVLEQCADAGITDIIIAAYQSDK